MSAIRSEVVSYCWNRLTPDGRGGLRGSVVTPLGIVEVWSDADWFGKGPACRFQMARRGRAYRQKLMGKRYSERYLVTLARRFAEEVAGGEP